MGGPGSGNRGRCNKKEVVEDCLSIDANRWMREGILKADVHHYGTWRWTYSSGKSFPVNYVVDSRAHSSAVVRLSYSWTWNNSQQPESADYSIRLTTTDPHFGGLRWWFVCPLIVNGRPCNRAAAAESPSRHEPIHGAIGAWWLPIAASA